MAKAKLNPLLNQVTGSIGNIVIKQTDHGPVLSSKSKEAQKSSDKQRAHRVRMGEDAKWFYRHQMKDPVREAHYRARAKQERIPVSAFVMGGYMKHGEKFADLEAPGAVPGGESDGRDGGDVE